MRELEYPYKFDLPERPFLRGVARLFDFTGSLDREFLEYLRASRQARLERLSRQINSAPHDDASCGWKQDAEAIRGDWQTVGDSLRRAMGVVDKEIQESNNGV